MARLLMRRARQLYADQPLALELDQTIYALDSTTIDLCLSLFPWAPFQRSKAAVKIHTLPDLRGTPILEALSAADSQLAPEPHPNQLNLFGL